jgi:hypothetical protein
VGAQFLDLRVNQLLRERSLAQQIINPAMQPQVAPQYCLAFIKVNVTAGRTQIVAREQTGLVRRRFGNRCFDSTTEDLKDIREAATEEKPVFVHDPGSQNSNNYRRMTDEFLRRFP